MIEEQFDLAFIAQLATKEKQIQQNYRPLIAVHKWFARRPGAVFRGLVLAEFAQGVLSDTYFASHCLEGVRVGDPFMGGGTPIMEANRVGADVVGYDINPMAYWIVQQELAQIDHEGYLKAANNLVDALRAELDPYYTTTCETCQSVVPVKYFLWVKTQRCQSCQEPIDLFPGYLVAENVRHPRSVLVCPGCGLLNEVQNSRDPGTCTRCETTLKVEGPASRGIIACPHCGATNSYPNNPPSVPQHRLFALEYYCPSCKVHQSGRFFKSPDRQDLSKVREAEELWDRTGSQFVPEDAIPPGDETDRLHRWGYSHYRQLFNARQLLGLERSAGYIAHVSDRSLRHALATNFSDLLRYQNMLCRYDTMALKSLDVFSLHGFPVGLIQVESNLFGIRDPFKRTLVGSGGWFNIIEKFAKAKAYGDSPSEWKPSGSKKRKITMPTEWIGRERNGGRREVLIRCSDATQADLAPSSLDAVFTDPPYFDNVQYAELMDFCYIWLRRLVQADDSAFDPASTRHIAELTGNSTLDRGLDAFTDGLSRVFQRWTSALKPGGPFAFTFHHNTLDAYVPIAVGMLDAELTCTAALPVPAEMSASIHINGTGSSVVDTVFVGRQMPAESHEPPSVESLAQCAGKDFVRLREGGVRVTDGDRRCVIYGLLTATVINLLRDAWDKSANVSVKRQHVATALGALPSWRDVDVLARNEEQALLDATTINLTEKVR